MSNYGLRDAELHTAWVLRPYLEQSRIPNFGTLSWTMRRSAVERLRNAHLLSLQQRRQQKTYRQARKNYAHTAAYVHLTHDERVRLVRELADVVGGWGFARLFAECIDKLYFDPVRTGRPIEVQAFEQIVSRFERYLRNMSQQGNRTAAPPGQQAQLAFGLLVHDNNETIARKHTNLMRSFHEQGTQWADIEHIIETPMFVDSRLTSMVQVADLCAYALRRFVEKQEDDLFRRVFPRADRMGAYAVGVRHFSIQTCSCHICESHN